MISVAPVKTHRTGGIHSLTGDTYSYFQIVFVFNNSQAERTVRNFKEKEIETDQNGKIIPEDLGEELPF